MLFLQLLWDAILFVALIALPMFAIGFAFVALVGWLSLRGEKKPAGLGRGIVDVMEIEPGFWIAQDTANGLRASGSSRSQALHRLHHKD